MDAEMANGPEDEVLDWGQVDWARLRTTYDACVSGSSRRRRLGT